MPDVVPESLSRTTQRLLSGLRTGILVIAATVLVTASLFRNLHAYHPLWSQLVAFALLFTLIAAELVLLLLRRSWRRLRWAGVTLAYLAAALSEVTLPRGAGTTALDWVYGTTGWVGLLLLLDLPIGYLGGFLAVHEAIVVVDIVLTSPTEITLLNDDSLSVGRLDNLRGRKPVLHRVTTISESLRRPAGRNRLMVGLAAALPLLALVTALPSAAAPLFHVPLPSPNMNDTTGTVAALDPGMPLSLRVYLADRPGLAAAASAVSDPRSSQYTRFLSSAQYDRAFAPTAAQAAAVSGWLNTQGMTNTSTTAHYFAVTATVAQADAAFDTQVSEFDSTVTEFGQTFEVREPGVSGGFSVPASLGDDVLSVTGIDQIDLPDDTAATHGQMMPTIRARAKARPASAMANATATSTF